MRPLGEFFFHDFPDRAIRTLLENPANLRDTLQAIVPDLAARLDFERCEVLPREYLLGDWRSRESDLLFRIPFRSPGSQRPVFVCILIEHQSAQDPRMPLRILLYAVLYWEREWKAWEDRHDAGAPLRLSPILPIVFHTGPDTWRTNTRLSDLIEGPEEFRPFAPQWQPLFWNLADQTPEGLLASAAAWLQALAVVRTERAESEPFRAVLAQVLLRVLEEQGRNRVRGYDLLVFVLSWVLRRRPRTENAELRAFLDETIKDEALKREVIEVTETLGQTWEELTVERERNAERNAELRHGRRILRDLLSDRFTAVPEELVRRIEACTDLQLLNVATRQVYRIGSLDELQL
jgi:hypothetical protein